MYFCEIRFIPSDKSLDFIKMLQCNVSPSMIIEYLESLYANGQIHENYFVVYSDGIEVAYVNCPETKSLILKNNSKTTKSALRQLKKYYEVKHNVIGLNLTCGGRYCECKEPSFYILQGDMDDDSSPIICGDCGMPVPLYKLPCMDEETGFASLFAWHKAYVTATDMLNANMPLTSQFEKELCNPKSDIAEWGREYCSELEECLQKPVYYNLYNPKGKKVRKCPSCGKILRYISMNDGEESNSEDENDDNSRILKANFGNEYDWCACDKCRIIMDVK